MQDATKVDLKRELGRLYKATASPEVIDVPTMAFLAVDGIGDPNTSPAYADAIAALYAVSYGLKFAIKRGPASLDYTVMPLEGLWWADDMNSFMKGRRDLWHWTAMIAQPEVVDADLVAQVVGETKKKKPGVALDQLRFEMFTEGRAAQLLHTGPYAAEAPASNGSMRSSWLRAAS